MCKIKSKIAKLFKKKLFFTRDNLNISGVEIGEFTYGLPIIQKWTNKYNLKIGKFCSIAENVKILLDGNHRIDWVSTYPFGDIFKDIPLNPGHPAGKGDMEIGNDVWLGIDVLILPGVKIGDGAVIAAGSVVTKNVREFEIVGGNPAKHIKFRFNDEQINELKKISWWNWDFDKIKKEVQLLQSENINNFINKHKII